MTAMVSQITSLTKVYQILIPAQTKENIKAPRHWPSWGEFTGEFPAQKASNAENVAIWWRHHVRYQELKLARPKQSNMSWVAKLLCQNELLERPAVWSQATDALACLNSIFFGSNYVSAMTNDEVINCVVWLTRHRVYLKRTSFNQAWYHSLWAMYVPSS